MPKVHTDKFEPRTTPHVFVDYPFGTKGYKVLSLATRNIHVSRGVVFYESVFPFSLGSKNVSLYNVLKSGSFPTYIESSSPHSNVQTPTSITSPEVHQSPESSPANDNTMHTSDISSFHHSPIPATSHETTSHHSPTPTQSETHILRKSNITHKTPAYLKDYICNLPNTSHPNVLQGSPSLSALFSNHSHVTPDALCSQSQHLVTNICKDSEPSSYGEATLSLA